MEKIKRSMRNLKIIILILMITILLLNFCCIAVLGFDIWNGIVFFLGCGIMAFGGGMYAIIRNGFCLIEITATEIILMNLKGTVRSFSAGDILKVVYGLMNYKLYFSSDGKQQIIQCPPGVRVYKNGKWHRGIWIDDFPQAKFEDA